MRLNHLNIENHSRIGDLDIEIRRHAVLIGANDVGKTSVLRLLNLLFGASQGQLYQQLSPGDLANSAKPLVVEVCLVEFSQAERTLFPNEISIDPANRTESLTFRMEVELSSDDPDAVEVSRWFPDAGFSRGPTTEQRKCFGWRYLPATRSGGATAVDGPNSALQTLLKAIDLGKERGSLSAILGEFNTELASNAALVQLLKAIAGHLSKAMPRTVEPNGLAVRTAADPELDVLANVSMFFSEGETYTPLTEQSDGLRHLMSMTLFDLAEGAANIIAVDEPEIHLHPLSQRTVAELFSESSNQKILVTHSPYIVHRFEPAQVIAVDPDGRCH